MSLSYRYSPSLRKVRVEIQSRDHGRTLLVGLLSGSQSATSLTEPRMALPTLAWSFLQQSRKCPHKQTRTLTGPAVGGNSSTEAPSSYMCQDDNQDSPSDHFTLPFLTSLLSLLCSPRQVICALMINTHT